MTETVRFANGSIMEVETEDEGFKRYLESVDISSDFEDEFDTAYYGTSRVESVSTSYYQYEHRELKIDELEQISGVDRQKAEALYREGYKNVNDVRIASQSELSDVDEIDNALAAWIKADVGDHQIDAEEIVDELEEDNTTSFLDEESLMVDIDE